MVALICALTGVEICMAGLWAADCVPKGEADATAAAPTGDCNSTAECNGAEGCAAPAGCAGTTGCIGAGTGAVTRLAGSTGGISAAKAAAPGKPVNRRDDKTTAKRIVI
ncbi:hypothetical protein [Gluconacetobacter takamatsuzukensis]|uniref:hypothetical protein n=1 Tax=Gluconacetobacter takamatsuzukensis TaxID=1286190 RepID=UPI001FE8BB01|nr:hypothetical protein [Gluconacetobacter takamatsuzukensis]